MASIGYFEPNPTIAIAVSGGADSMALLFLADNWAKAHNGEVIALTVNHNIRNEAESEAQQVYQWCKDLRIKQYILPWEHINKPITAIQKNAREARYQILTDHCKKHNILHLLTAHHNDDQIETMFFRLARGSGLSGLSAMPLQTIISGVRILRPLLTTSKTRLIATLQSYKQDWIEDPSNQNIDYGRVMIRKKLSETDNNENLKIRASYAINRLSCFRNILENKIASEMTNVINIYQAGYAIIDLSKFYDIKKTIGEQILSALIQTLNGEYYPPRNEKISNLYKDLNIKKSKLKRSIGGLLFEVTPEQKLLVYREEKAIENPVHIKNGELISWDNRFLATWFSDGICPDFLIIRSLGSDGFSQISKNSLRLLKNSIPKRIIRTIPSLWLLEELISAPHIGYMKKNNSAPFINCDIKFYPTKPLAGSSFFVMNK